MQTKEKMLLLQTLMIDIRMDWDFSRTKRYRDKRITKCLQIISDFHVIAMDSKHKDYKLISQLHWFKFHQTIGVYLAGGYEGRYLRMSICDGGYEGLEAFHRLKPKFSLRSKEFCQTVKALCRTEFTFFTE